MSTSSCRLSLKLREEEEVDHAVSFFLFSSPLSSSWIFVCLSLFLSCYFYKSLPLCLLFFVSPVAFLSLTPSLSILVQPSAALLKDYERCRCWTGAEACHLFSAGHAGVQIHLDHRQRFKSTLRRHTRESHNVLHVCVRTHRLHTRCSPLLPLTDWCLLASQRVGVKTTLCNWIPVATTPAPSLWQQSLAVSLSLKASVRLNVFFLFPHLAMWRRILCSSGAYFSQPPCSEPPFLPYCMYEWCGTRVWVGHLFWLKLCVHIVDIFLCAPHDTSTSQSPPCLIALHCFPFGLTDMSSSKDVCIAEAL